jgi:hypothetical protein
MLVSVEHDQAGLALLHSQWIDNFSCLKEVKERGLIWNFLPLLIEFFATSHCILISLVTLALLPLLATISYMMPVAVSVCLKTSISCFAERCLTGFTSEDSLSSSISFFLQLQKFSLLSSSVRD